MSDLVIVSERRRSWPEELKRKLLEEAEQPGENICRVARRHDIEPTQLYQWRKKFRDEASATKFIPVEVIDDTGCKSEQSGTLKKVSVPPLNAGRPDPRLEIACKSGHTLFVPCDIEPKRLSRLVSALGAA